MMIEYDYGVVFIFLSNLLFYSTMALPNLVLPNNFSQPGPRENLLQCFIKRNRSTQTYYLYLSLTGCKYTIKLVVDFFL
jgi:hypothetical protein